MTGIHGNTPSKRPWPRKPGMFTACVIFYGVVLAGGLLLGLTVDQMFLGVVPFWLLAVSIHGLLYVVLSGSRSSH